MRPTVDRYATDNWPTYHRQLADIQPTYDRYSVEMCRPLYRPPVDRLSVDVAVDTRSIVGRLSIDSRPSVDRQSTECRSSVDRVSIECRPSVDRLSTATSTAIAVDIAVDITYSKHDPKILLWLNWLKQNVIMKMLRKWIKGYKLKTQCFLFHISSLIKCLHQIMSEVQL